MKNNVGRPAMPEGEAKQEVYSAKLSGDKSRRAEKYMKQSGENKSEYVRDAVEDKIDNPPIWVTSRWTQEELDKQFIAFRLVAPTRIAEGVGRMSVRRNPKGKIAVDIFVTEDQGYKGVVTRYWLSQPLVDKIELNPDGKQVKFKLVM